MHPIDLILHFTQLSNDHLAEAEIHLQKAHEILQSIGGNEDANSTTNA